MEVYLDLRHTQLLPENILNQLFAGKEHGGITEGCANSNVFEPNVARSIYETNH
jgi:hypothetical protein